MAKESDKDKVNIELELPKEKGKISINREGSEEETRKRRRRQERKPESKTAEKVGYEPEELLKLPAEPPKKLKGRRRPDAGQVLMILLGFSLVVVGLVLLSASYLAALVVGIFGVGFIAMGVLVRS